MKREFSISGGSVSFYTVPTDAPEADGTFSWTSTSMVLVQLECGTTKGIGYTYADAGTAAVAQTLLKEIVQSTNPLRRAETLQRMLREVRNLGETGVTMMAISAIDNALWDLSARLFDVPLVSLWGKSGPAFRSMAAEASRAIQTNSSLTSSVVGPLQVLRT